MHLGEDKLYWGYGKKIFFTMKEAYKILIGADIQPIDQKWGKLWKKKLWPKITVFNWVVIRNQILTGENLKKRGMVGPY